MSYPIIISEEAHFDTAEAYNYYEKKSPGLGERFLEELLRRYDEIVENPENYGFIDERKIIRDIKLRHFPYLVVYEFYNDAVIVYAVFNGYKDSSKKIKT